MGIVTAGFSTSLDGFIADPQGEVGHLFDWYNSGDTEFRFPGGSHSAKVSAASAALLEEYVDTLGAIVTGRKQFDIAHGWAGRHPMDVPVFVVTHHVAPEWIYEGSPFTFVTAGVQSALDQAKAVAGDKNVAMDGANVVQQGIKAGLVDEIYLHLVPFLLTEGIRFFDHLDAELIKLEQIRAIIGTGVTHLHYRFIK